MFVYISANTARISLRRKYTNLDYMAAI